MKTVKLQPVPGPFLRAIAALCMLGFFGGAVATPCLRAFEDTASSSNPAPSAAAMKTAYFALDVVPILTRLGCNSGGCHGKATGQNGFRLSLLGFEPDFDYEAIVQQGRGRRLALSAPRQSLLLEKATGRVPHGGGTRLAMESDDYRTLLSWVASGARPPQPSDPILESIVVEPSETVFAGGQGQERLTVTAQFSDGTSRDVTQQAVYQSNEPEIAEVAESGLVEPKGFGLATVMVRYCDQIGTFRAIIPLGPPLPEAPTQSPGSEPASESSVTGTPVDPSDAANSGVPGGVARVDGHLETQWQRLAIEPSPSASDGEFIRRASLDICGTLPTPDEVRQYASDVRPDKRGRLIDALLARPEHSAYFAMKWGEILQNRGRGYSTARQREGTALFTSWIRDSIAANKPYDRFVSEILTATGSQQTNPPAVWYRSVRTTQDYVESVAQAFLGVRIQCAQCHHHPAERWSQDDYYALAAVFARVGRKGGFADAEVPTSEVIFSSPDGRVIHPRTGADVMPRALGGPAFQLGAYDDPRRAFARWLVSPDNPYFARTLANRLWGHFMSRGIIHPIDDARSTNPPSNPDLLECLAAELVASRYDVKHLIRVICGSRAYAASFLPSGSNASDVQNFARYYPRRLPAEVLLDALSQVLEAPGTFSAGAGPFPAGTRAIELPDEAVPSQFLDVFGRPDRSTACECQRVDSPALGQMLALVSASEVQEKLAAPSGYAARLAASGLSHEDNVNDIFWRFFARPPRPEETQAACEYLANAADVPEAYRSLLWSLLATNEFLFNH